jgi:hypothetical protein
MNRINDHNDESHHQQDVDETAERVRGDEPKQPEHQEYDRNGPDHRCIPYL